MSPDIDGQLELTRFEEVIRTIIGVGDAWVYHSPDRPFGKICLRHRINSEDEEHFCNDCRGTLLGFIVALTTS